MIFITNNKEKGTKTKTQISSTQYKNDWIYAYYRQILIFLIEGITQPNEGINRDKVSRVDVTNQKVCASS